MSFEIWVWYIIASMQYSVDMLLRHLLYNVVARNIMATLALFTHSHTPVHPSYAPIHLSHAPMFIP